MLKREFTYKDFEGKEVTETYYFNLTQAEVMELELSAYGGIEAMVNRLLEEKNTEDIVKLFKKIILMSVGEKSFDNRRFIKNDEIRDNFYQTEAYSQLFCELVTDGDKAHAFLRSLVSGTAQPVAAPALAPA